MTCSARMSKLIGHQLCGRTQRDTNASTTETFCNPDTNTTETHWFCCQEHYDLYGYTTPCGYSSTTSSASIPFWENYFKRGGDSYTRSARSTSGKSRKPKYNRYSRSANRGKTRSVSDDQPTLREAGGSKPRKPTNQVRSQSVSK